MIETMTLLCSFFLSGLVLGFMGFWREMLKWAGRPAGHCLGPICGPRPKICHE